MATHAEQAAKIRESISNARSANDVVQILDHIETLLVAATTAADDFLWLRLLAFRTLRTLASAVDGTAQRIILELLAPLCLRSESTDEGVRTIERQRLLELLRDWIEELEPAAREIVRTEVIEMASNVIRHDGGESGFDLLSRLGYRDAKLVELLLALSMTSDARGDRALSTLVALGVPENLRGRLVDRAHERLEQKADPGPRYAWHGLADPAFLDTAMSVIRDVHDVPWILSAIADRHWDNLELQNRLSTGILQRAKSGDEQFTRWLMLGSNLAPVCNSPDVIRYFLSRLFPGELTSDSQRLRYIVCLRLADCVRPAQLPGWHDPNNRDAIAALKEDACRDTGAVDRFAGHDGSIKEEAWRAALSLASREPLEWLETIIANEANGFVQANMMKIAACFSFTDLPKSVVELITKREDLSPPGDADKYFRRNASVELALSAGNRQAFEVLLNFGFTQGGQVLLSTVEAIGTLACHLVRHGADDVISRLAAAVSQPSSAHQRTVAVGALRDLAVSGLLPSRYLEALLSAVETTDVEPYIRSRALEAIGFLGNAASSAGGHDLALRFALDATSSELQWRGIEALIRFRTWEDYLEPIAAKLGLVRNSVDWTVSNSAKLNTWQVFLIALLCEQQSDTFGHCVGDLLRNAGHDAAYSLVRQVIRMAPSLSGELRTEFADAIIFRSQQRQSRALGEVYLFDALVRISPAALLAIDWNAYWWQWVPDARASMADAFSNLKALTEQQKSQAMSILVPLTVDSMYAVRRSAYRAMAEIDVQTLRAQCEAWITSGLVELRERAAEAMSYAAEGTGAAEAASMFQELLVDEERSVRDAAERVWVERRHRIWALEYLTRIISVNSDDNESVLANFCYGRALSKIGDDAAIDSLNQHLNTTELSPHLYFWKRQIGKETAENWKKTTRDWPEPWIRWEGIVEELEGEVVRPNGEAQRVSLSLWKTPQQDPSSKGSWGGMIRPLSLDPFHSQGWNRFTIRIGGRRDADASVKSNSSSVGIIFFGDGNYPESDQLP